MSAKSNSVALLSAEVPKSIDNAVTNLTDKPSQSIGQTISDLWQLVLGGRVAFAAEKQKMKYAHELEEYRKSLEAKVTAIPEEKRTKPQIQIAAQALDDSKYCVESEALREMFSSLIANSMNTDYLTIIHPSFSKIIQQLSPLDAQMLLIFQEFHHRGGVALVDYTKEADGTGYYTIAEHIPEIVPDNCPLSAVERSITSLQRLGLIEIHADEQFTDESRYAFSKCNALYTEILRDAKIHGYKINVIKRYAKLTAFGKDFVKVCLD